MPMLPGVRFRRSTTSWRANGSTLAKVRLTPRSTERSAIGDGRWHLISLLAPPDITAIKGLDGTDTTFSGRISPGKSTFGQPPLCRRSVKVEDSASGDFYAGRCLRVKSTESKNLGQNSAREFT